MSAEKCFAPLSKAFTFSTEISSPVSCAVKIEEEMQDASLERALKALVWSCVPLAINDLKRHVLVWRAGAKANDARLAVLASVRLDGVLGRM